MSAQACIVMAEGRVTDIDAVMTVMGDSFDARFGEAWTAPQCAGLLQMAGVWLTIARDGEQAIGFALARVVAGEAELLLLAVRRARQRAGVGVMLVREFVAEAARRGAARLHLEVRDGNPALGLYAREGFEAVGRRANYYSGHGQVYDALTLAKTLR